MGISTANKRRHNLNTRLDSPRLLKKRRKLFQGRLRRKAITFRLAVAIGNQKAILYNDSPILTEMMEWVMSLALGKAEHVASDPYTHTWTIN